MSKTVAQEDQILKSDNDKEPEKVEASSSQEVDIIRRVSDLLDADIYMYSGILDREGANRFIELGEVNRSKENAALILTTNGGTADAAYRIVRYLKRTYKQFTLYVFGPCKSAGTLIALGADEIVMSCWGEFGPLDVQLLRRDDLAFRNSGLDIAEALKSVGDHAFMIFEKQFLEIIERSGGTISTGTAGDIAKSIAAELLKPITAQIDPLQIGEVQRALKVASDYAERLEADPRTIARLVKGYSSHSFVIDYQEAERLFPNVRLAHPVESQLERKLISASREGTGHDCIREVFPHPTAVIAFLEPESEAEQSDEREQKKDVLEHGNVASKDETSADGSRDTTGDS